MRHDAITRHRALRARNFWGKPLRRSWPIITVIIAAASFGIWTFAQKTDSQPLPSLFPPGALLYVEATDFQHVLGEWTASQEKKKWLTTDNFGVLSRSRLLGRLMQAGDEFSVLAGVPIQASLADQLAGAQSAIAIYDLSELRFVYITRLASARLNASALWNTRGKFQVREAAGISFYVKGEGRSVAFASHDGYFLLATDIDRMAAALTLLAGQRAPSLQDESWFSDTVKLSAKQGDLRLVTHLTPLLATPQFRTYWLQRNASELRGFSSGIADLFESNDGFEERRALLRSAAQPPAQDEAALSGLNPFVPRQQSLYRAWSAPDSATLHSVLQQVVLADGVAANNDWNREAPSVESAFGAVADNGLETRIDEPAYQRGKAPSIDPVAAAINAMEPRALLHVQATSLLNDNVFVVPGSEAVILCGHPDRAALDRALAATAGIEQTGTLDPLRVSIKGQAVILSRLPETAGEGTGTNGLPVKSASYAAVYQHSVEWPHYQQLFALIDRSAANPERTADPNEPAFFSGNIRSLGDTLSRLRRATIVTNDEGAVVRDVVHYDLGSK